VPLLLLLCHKQLATSRYTSCHKLHEDLRVSSRLLLARLLVYPRFVGANTQ
jgi:hypothetical protein